MITSLGILVAIPGFAHAAPGEDLIGAPLIKQGDETLLLDLGGIVNQFHTTLQLNGRFQNGTELNLEHNGVKKTQSSFQAAGSWRFLPRHRFDVEYFETSRSGSASYNTEIAIGDNVFPLGAAVSARAKTELLLADYRYSFVKSDRIEWAGLLGIYGGRFSFDVNATGNAGNVVVSTSTSASTYVPVPLIGTSLDWYVDPRWRISGNVQGLKAHIGSVDGHAVVAIASVDYTVIRNFGVGVRGMYSDLSADVSKPRFNGSFSWRMNSVTLYGRLLF